MPVYDVAVVGLGAMGAATLHALARRGVRAIGLEQRTPAHPLSSSYGETRVIRLAYFEDPAYVPLLRLAYARWRDLEALSGQSILTVTGIVEASHRGGFVAERSLASSVEHGLPHTVLSAAEVNRRFPAFCLPADWTCVHQPDGGVLYSEKIIKLYVAMAAACGAEVREHAGVAAVEPRGDGVHVRLDSGERVEAGAAVLAAGPWMRALVPDLAPSLRLTRQPLMWFAPVAPALVGANAMPVFLLEAEEDLIYGFPDIGGAGVKAASHAEGETIASAEAPRTGASVAEAERLRGLLARYVPAAAGPLLRTHTCVYTRAPQDHFIVGVHPSTPNLVLASACSGHGFKFASVLGEALADLAVRGETDTPIGLFSPARVLQS